MRLIVDQFLATGFIPINTRQQRASLPFKPGVMERKVYNNDDITFFSILTFAKLSVIMCCSPNHEAVRAATHTHIYIHLHTGQCKSTGGCYNELVVAYFGTGGGVKWRKR